MDGARDGPGSLEDTVDQAVDPARLRASPNKPFRLIPRPWYDKWRPRLLCVRASHGFYVTSTLQETCSFPALFETATICRVPQAKVIKSNN